MLALVLNRASVTTASRRSPIVGACTSLKALILCVLIERQ